MDTKKRGLATEQVDEPGNPQAAKADRVQRALASYRRARGEAERLKDLASEAQKRFRGTESELVDALCEAGWKSIKDQDDVLFHLHPKCWFSTREELREKTIEWLRSKGQEPSDFLVEKIAEARLREFMKGVLETDGELGIPEFFELDTAPGITAKGWRAAHGKKEAEE